MKHKPRFVLTLLIAGLLDVSSN